MLSVDDALTTVLNHAKPLASEQITITATLGRILAADIVSKREHPPWDNSAMDGYALQWSDIKEALPASPVTLRRIGELQAGAIANQRINSGETIQIMTGAPLPLGADTIVAIEDSRQHNGTITILKSGSLGDHIRRKGEDFCLGETIIPAGTKIRAAEVGLMAAAGHVMTQVSQRPRVSILATGDELAELGESVKPQQIINSNAYSIAAQVQEAGGIPVILKIAKDDKDDLNTKIQTALEADISIILGGVSVGKYDYAKDVIEQLGCHIKFWHVKMRPGYPMAFGVRDEPGQQRNKLLFGLPGNPVSCMVSFYLFVRPLILTMMGAANPLLKEVTAILETPLQHKPGRRHYARAITHYHNGRYHVRLTGNQSSGLVTSMAHANSLLLLPEEGGTFKTGDALQVQLLPL